MIQSNFCRGVQGITDSVAPWFAQETPTKVPMLHVETREG